MTEKRESIDWLKRAIKTLSDNPESPESLRIMSNVQRAAQPRIDASDGLVTALAQQIQNPCAESDLQVVLAQTRWEAACQGNLDDELLSLFKRDAAELIKRNRCRPPEMTEILDISETPVDYEYTLVGTLGGLQGTWHRLWSSISSARYFAQFDSSERMCNLQNGNLIDLRKEFESMLGREMTVQEWGRLTAHAHRHCDEVMIPAMAEYQDKDATQQS